MRSLSQSRATYSDLLALPDTVVGELLGGELFASPRPRALHVVVASSLGAELGGAFQAGRHGPGGWWILDEPELHWDEDVLVPDLAGWRRERLPEIPDEPAFTLVPDWVCEILSPSTARVDLMRKLPRYAVAGVRHAWLVNPSLRSLEVFRLEGPSWVLAGAFSGEDVVRAEPFAAFELNLGQLWGTGEGTPSP